MTPTLVNVAFGVLIGAALLGAAFDRRSLAIVAVAAALPDLDSLAGLVIEGGANSVLHAVWLPAIAFGGLYYDTQVRESSWLRETYGWWTVRVSWVALTVYVVAGIGADLFGSGGVNLFFPVYDQFMSVDGRFTVTLLQEEGVPHSVAGLSSALPGIETHGSTGEYAVDTWLAPTGEKRRLRIVDEGWQVVVVMTATVVGAIRLWREG